MTTINGAYTQNQVASAQNKISYSGKISQKEKTELSQLLSGRNWREFDFDGNGKLNRNEINDAKMTILSEKEERTVNVDEW